MAKKIYVVGISQCYLEAGRAKVLELFNDKKNRIEAVFARKDDMQLLSWVRVQLAAELKSVVLENNGNISHLSNAPIFYNSKVKFITDYIKGNIGKKNILIFGNGDPNFFGIGANLIALLKENERRFVEIYPSVSFMQIGFSKLKIPMTDALIISLQGRDIKHIYEPLHSEKEVIGLYTDDVNTPSKIHSELEEKGFLKDYEFYILTDLCSKNEKIYKNFTKDILEDAGLKKNIVILNRKQGAHGAVKIEAKEERIPQARYGKERAAMEPLHQKSAAPEFNVIGIEDDKYVHASGEPVKKEIRAISLAMMNLKQDSIIVDAGSGSGSMSIEISGIADKGMVYAIDKDKMKIGNLKVNMKKFKRPNIEPVFGKLPEALSALEAAGKVDSVFVGTGGAELESILTDSLKIIKEGGVVVVNCGTLNSLGSIIAFIKTINSPAIVNAIDNFAVKHDIVAVNISRLKQVTDKEDSYFQALNQVYIVKLTKVAKPAGEASDSSVSPAAPPPRSATQTASNFRRRHKHVFNKENITALSGNPKVKVRNKAIKNTADDTDER